MGSWLQALTVNSLWRYKYPWVRIPRALCMLLRNINNSRRNIDNGGTRQLCVNVARISIQVSRLPIWHNHSTVVNVMNLIRHQTIILAVMLSRSHPETFRILYHLVFSIYWRLLVLNMAKRQSGKGRKQVRVVMQQGIECHWLRRNWVRTVVCRVQEENGGKFSIRILRPLYPPSQHQTRPVPLTHGSPPSADSLQEPPLRTLHIWELKSGLLPLFMCTLSTRLAG